jgi:hypothetical protein
MTAWRLPGRFGDELWQPAATGFASVTIAGDRIPLPATPALLDRIGARHGTCPHPGPYPTAFRHCPDCGARLSSPRSEPPSQSWSPPFGAANGLPTLDEPRRPDPDSRQDIPMPGSAQIALAVAGTPPRLLACDRITGWVHAWSEPDTDWHRLVQLPACALPRWSWSAAATPHGLALPTDRGPAWLDLTLPRQTPVRLTDAPYRPAGGAAPARSGSLVPLRTKAGLMLARHCPDGPLPGDWTLHPVLGATDAPETVFAQPISSAEATVWCERTGLLLAQDTADGLVVRWRRWTDGVVPLPGLRPVTARDGTLHQLSRQDADTLVHEALPLAGQPPERRVARGYSPGTGRAVFRENTRLRLPWDERPLCDYPLADDHFLLPLLAFDEDRLLLAVCDRRAWLGHFLGDPDAAAPPADAAPHLCTLMYSRGPRMLEPLDCILRAHHAWDLTVAIHAGHLLAHGAVENRCHRWKLVDDK